MDGARLRGNDAPTRTTGSEIPLEPARPSVTPRVRPALIAASPGIGIVPGVRLRQRRGRDYERFQIVASDPPDWSPVGPPEGEELGGSTSPPTAGDVGRPTTAPDPEWTD
jgi:hypothetical protein